MNPINDMLQLPSLLLAQSELNPVHELLFRNGASTYVDRTDFAWDMVFYPSLIAFVILTVALIFFSIRYTKRKNSVPQASAAHNTVLEIIWSVIPGIAFAAMFFVGVWAYMPKLQKHAGAEEIYVTAEKWAWGLQYDGGSSPLQSQVVSGRELPMYAFPVGRPVTLIMTSKDVIHSFYIPEFRIKRDVFPNRFTQVTFEATGKPTHTVDQDGNLVAIDDRGEVLSTSLFKDDAGTKLHFGENHPYFGKSPAEMRGYYLFCTEYCGDQHAQMAYRVATLSDSDYAKWKEGLKDTSGIPLIDLGKSLFAQQGCGACHSVDGSAGTGPTWKNIWGETHNFTDGTSAVVDFNYIRQSIYEPNDKIVQGYPAQMATYQGKIDERGILALATYIKSLSDDFQAEAEAQSTAAAAAIGSEEDGAQDAAEELLKQELINQP